MNSSNDVSPNYSEGHDFLFFFMHSSCPRRLEMKIESDYLKLKLRIK